MGNHNFKLVKRVLCLPVMLALAAFLLTGCLQVNIGIEIDEHFTSSLSYSIELDTGWVDSQYHEILANALNDLGWHYQEALGFNVGINTETDVYTLSMKKSVINDTLTDAFNSLEIMLTDEKSTAFMRVDMALESFPGADSFIIDAMADIPQIINLSSYGELPTELLEVFENAVLTSGGTITVTVPASELVSHTHDADIWYRLATMAAPLSFSGQTEIGMQGIVIYAEDGTQTGTFDSVINENLRMRETVFMVCLGAVLLLLIILLIILLRIRKHNRLYV